MSLPCVFVLCLCPISLSCVFALSCKYILFLEWPNSSGQGLEVTVLPASVKIAVSQQQQKRAWTSGLARNYYADFYKNVLPSGNGFIEMAPFWIQVDTLSLLENLGKTMIVSAITSFKINLAMTSWFVILSPWTWTVWVRLTGRMTMSPICRQIKIFLGNFSLF